MAKRTQSEQELSDTQHPAPERVVDAVFRAHSEFFDASDLVQVKYEMLRAHHVDRVSVVEASRRFGLSRQTFYLANSAFRKRRLEGLLPGRPGPKGPRKVTPEVATFIRSEHREHPDLGYRQLADAIAAKFGVQLHPRTVWRELQKKKHPSAGAPE